MKYKFFPAVLIAGAFAFAGCKKNNDDGPQGRSSVTYQITTSGRSNALGTANLGENTSSTNRTNAGSITWTDGYITVSEIKFEAKGDNKIEFKSKVVRQIDLFDAIATIGDIDVIPGTYEKIGFKIKLEPEGSFAAFELKGFYENNGVIIPIVLRVDRPIHFKFEKKTPTVIEEGFDFSALHTLALNFLNNGISIDLLDDAVLVNNTIVISASSNEELFEKLFDNLNGIVLKVEIKTK